MSSTPRSLLHSSPRSGFGLARFSGLRLALSAAVVLAGVGLGDIAMADHGNDDGNDHGDDHGNDHGNDHGSDGAVFAMTNDAAGNQVVAYKRAEDGTLRLAGTYDTGGLGTSRIRLSSQSSVVLTPNGRRLLVANVGSSEISVFAVNGAELHLLDVVDSQGTTPNSIAIRGDFVYVLNNGGAGMGNLATFRLRGNGTLSFVPGSLRPMSAAGSDPAQVAVTPDGNALVVTEKATNKIDSWPLVHGLPTVLSVHPADGVTPFGIDFANNGVFVVTNATGGDIGKATATSYKLEGQHVQQLRTISGSVGDDRSEVCWTIISKDERFVYVTNFGDGTISSYDLLPDGRLRLRKAVAAATSSFGQLSIRDEELSIDGRYLYAIDITAQKVFGWRVQHNGDLVPITAVSGVPGTVAGIAVR